MDRAPSPFQPIQQCSVPRPELVSPAPCTSFFGGCVSPEEQRQHNTSAKRPRLALPSSFPASPFSGGGSNGGGGEDGGRKLGVCLGSRSGADPGCREVNDSVITLLTPVGVRPPAPNEELPGAVCYFDLKQQQFRWHFSSTPPMGGSVARRIPRLSFGSDRGENDDDDDGGASEASSNATILLTKDSLGGQRADMPVL